MCFHSGGGIYKGMSHIKYVLSHSITVGNGQKEQRKFGQKNKVMEVRFTGCDQSLFYLLNETGHGILKIVFT